MLFTFDDPAVFPWGGEPILMNGRNVGELTSTGYSRRLGRAVAMGYARSSEGVLTDDLVLSARYEIDIAGRAPRRHRPLEAGTRQARVSDADPNHATDPS